MTPPRWTPLLALAALALAPGAGRADPAKTLAYAQVPGAAREAFRRYYFDALGGPEACEGLTLPQAELAVREVLQTDYNGDGAPDFIFSSPCAAQAGAGLLIASDPLGYRVASAFSAAVGRLDGELALIAPADCETATAAGPPCFAVRRLDAKTGRWGPVETLPSSRPPAPISEPPLAAPVRPPPPLPPAPPPPPPPPRIAPPSTAAAPTPPPQPRAQAAPLIKPASPAAPSAGPPRVALHRESAPAPTAPASASTAKPAAAPLARRPIRREAPAPARAVP